MIPTIGAFMFKKEERVTQYNEPLFSLLNYEYLDSTFTNFTLHIINVNEYKASQHQCEEDK